MNEIEKEDKFLIINWKHLGSLGENGQYHLRSVITEINAKFSGATKNKYIVCNQDEPYAEAVWQLILDGERQKEKDRQREAPP